MKKLALVLFTIIVVVSCRYTQAQPFKPEAQPQEIQQLNRIRIETNSGEKITYVFPTIEKLIQKLDAKGYQPKVPNQTEERLHAYLSHMAQLCATKAIVAAGVMAVRADNGDMNKLLKMVQDTTKKYKMPRYVAIDYERVVRQGFRTYSTPKEFIDNEFVMCVARGW